METLANLESFVRSADAGSFSVAARQLGVTPAAVSRNVAVLERNLGVRLLHRSTRKLALTEAGERFLEAIRDDLSGLQDAISATAGQDGEPVGVLKVSMSVTFGQTYVLPLLPAFLARYPGIRPEWRFENRQVDLVAEGYDAAIGGGFDLAPGVMALALGPAHIVAVASPAYLASRDPVVEPAQLANLDGIVVRSDRTGRIRHWTLRNLAGDVQPGALRERLVVNDPSAVVQAACLGLGAALVALPDALPHLESGRLVRVAPTWWADAGPISIYYTGRRLLPPKTRVFIDFLSEAFRRERYAERFAGSLGR